jgi:hypothetical protein
LLNRTALEQAEAELQLWLKNPPQQLIRGD